MVLVKNNEQTNNGMQVADVGAGRDGVVGVLIKRPDNIFSNGCIQQVLFLAKVFRNAGHTVEFLSVEQGYDRFELTDHPIRLTDHTTDFSKYKCVILGSLVLLEANNKAYIDNLVSFKIPIYNLICGNVFVLLQEEFVFDVHHIMHHYMQSYITENWVMEMYDYAVDYIAVFTGKPTRVVPYVWDPDVVRTYISKQALFRDRERVADKSKVNLLMFEPNMSVHKNALVPILIANEYYRKYPDRLNRVYVFCGDKVLPKMNKEVMGRLEVVRDSKLEMYGRIIMPYIVDNIQRHNPYLNVVVSYTLMNNLNFLHLELFDMGVPIVHNCEPYRENGLYFPDFEISKAVALIESTRTSFDKDAYIARCHPILERYASSDTSRVTEYDALLSAVPWTRTFSHPPLLSSLLQKDITPPPTPSQSPSVPTQTTQRGRFVQGEGYAAKVSTAEEVERLGKTLAALMKHPNKTHKHCEVFVGSSDQVAPVQAVVDRFAHRINARVLAMGDPSVSAQDASSFKKTHVLKLTTPSCLVSEIEVYAK